MTSALLEKELNTPISAGEEDVRQYLNEIRSYPRLTPEEERELARRCAEGDEEAIRQMVSCNLRLVVSVAREYSGRGVALLDLIQEGSIGLLAAARKFDYTLDYKFSTYATKWIRQGVTRCLLNHGSPIRVPLHTAERIRKVETKPIRVFTDFSEKFKKSRYPTEIFQQIFRKLYSAAIFHCNKLFVAFRNLSEIDSESGKERNRLYKKFYRNSKQKKFFNSFFFYCLLNRQKRSEGMCNYDNLFMIFQKFRNSKINLIFPFFH